MGPHPSSGAISQRFYLTLKSAGLDSKHWGGVKTEGENTAVAFDPDWEQWLLLRSRGYIVRGYASGGAIVWGGGIWRGILVGEYLGEHLGEGI